MLKIWRPTHIAFAADILADNLQQLGFDASIVDHIDAYDNSLYIIYNAASVKRKNLPANYIVYQTEVAGSNWFKPSYKQTLQEALAVWEYDPSNISFYEALNSNIFIVTPGVRPYQPTTEKNIALLFYGYLKKSPERQHFLQEISHHHPIEIIENKLANEMWELLKKTKVVLNIHYYQNAPLETFRINEALSFGCKVISQRSQQIPEKYLSIIEFADTPEEALILLNKPPINATLPDLSKLDNIDEIKQAITQPLALRPAKKKFISRLFGA